MENFVQNKIIIPYYIKTSFIQQHPNWIFLYSHDYLRKGALGQCVNFYGEPNTFPVFTCYKYCANPVYFSDSQDSFEKVNESFAKIPKGIIVPCRKIGEGCARLREFAPNLLQHIKKTIQALQWKEIKIDYGMD